jgi:pre-mRNA-processing factor 17
MNLVEEYGSSGSDEDKGPVPVTSTVTTSRTVDSAPMVASDTVTQYKFLSGKQVISHNVPYSILSAPESGPQNPFSTQRSAAKNTMTGHVEEHVMNNQTFETMQRYGGVLLIFSTFRRDKYTMNPDGQGGFVGDLDLARENNGALITDRETKKRKFNRESKGTAQDGEGIFNPLIRSGFLGPWAKYEDTKELKNPEVDDAVRFYIINDI